MKNIPVFFRWFTISILLAAGSARSADIVWYNAGSCATCRLEIDWERMEFRGRDWPALGTDTKVQRVVPLNGGTDGYWLKDEGVFANNGGAVYSRETDGRLVLRIGFLFSTNDIYPAKRLGDVGPPITPESVDGLWVLSDDDSRFQCDKVGGGYRVDAKRGTLTTVHCGSATIYKLNFTTVGSAERGMLIGHSALETLYFVPGLTVQEYGGYILHRPSGTAAGVRP